MGPRLIEANTATKLLTVERDEAVSRHKECAEALSSVQEAVDVMRKDAVASEKEALRLKRSSPKAGKN